MDELFNNMIANAWDSGLSGMYENPLSYEMIEDSVGRACDFFHIEPPESIEPGHTTAVSLGDTGTYGDEILFFNRLQLEDMGITGQDGLDLVMTHEGTHMALQDLDIGFNCYQEELCCDYMAGVRAGLNGMDVTQLENSLIDLPQDMEHPVGTLRVDAVEQGIAFAHAYMLTHNVPPTFNECLEDFKGEYMQGVSELAHLRNELYAHECAKEHYRHQMESDPDNEIAQHHFRESSACLNDLQADYNHKRYVLENSYSNSDITNGDSRYNPSFKGIFIDDKAYDTKKAQDYFKQEEIERKAAADAIKRGDISAAQRHESAANLNHKEGVAYQEMAKKSTK